MRETWAHARRFLLVSVAAANVSCSMISAPTVAPFSFEGVSLATPDVSADQGEKEKLLDVRVRSATDLARLAEERQLNIWPSVWFCDVGDSLVLRTVDGLRYMDAKVNYVSVRPEERERARKLIAETPADREKTYHFSVDASAYLRGEALEARSKYDLETSPKDLCAVVRGGGYLTKGFRSNVIVIPEAAIRSAFGNKTDKR